MAELLQKPAEGFVALATRCDELTRKAAERSPQDGRRPTEVKADVAVAAEPLVVRRRIHEEEAGGEANAVVPR